MLRSPNIVTMLGSTDTISEELLHFDTREPLGLDRSAQRRVLDAQHGVPSPLTPAQEHRLLETHFGRVAIILASSATGLESVEKAIQSISQKVFNCNLELARVRSPDELLRRYGSRGNASSPVRIGSYSCPLIVIGVFLGSGELAPYQLIWRSAVSASCLWAGRPRRAPTMADDRALAEEIEMELAELWTETALRSYLSIGSEKDCDLPELRQKMPDASGRNLGEGVRCLLHAMADRGEEIRRRG